MSSADPRIDPVEDNLVFFVDRVRKEGPDWVTDRSRPLVPAYSSEVAFPLFNLVAGARVALREAGELADSVGREFVARGLPWMWWTTPSYTSSELEDALAGLGLAREDVPGMYAELDAVPEMEGDIELGEVPVEDPGFGQTLIDGFGLPGFVLGPIQDFLGSFSPAEQVAVAAREDGRTVGVATGLMTDETIGIYNVATLADYRGRGIGSAVTTAVMSEGRERGCTNAILHTSAMGRSVYERLGFVMVCPTTQWVWMPSEE
jgi:GNAT superfamily N-acetyltransferase